MSVRRTIAAVVLSAVLLSVAGAAGYAFWLTGTPQYSLALLVRESHRGNGEGVDSFIDVGRVIDGFVPQIRDAAVEMYGRGIPPSAIQRLERIAEPLKPRMKDAARVEVRSLIRDKTKPFAEYPVFLLATGISAYSSVTREGESATVRTTTPEGDVIELVMERAGGRWRIVEVRDPELARRVAETVGQEVLVAATDGGLEQVAKTLDVKDVDALIEKLDGIFR